VNIAAILALINAAVPAVTNLVMLIKNDSGGTTVIISSAETATAADITNMQAWLAAHQTAATSTAVAAIPAK
jgi:hypothetical protein